MATTVNLRRILDRKQWEPCTPPPVGTAIGSFVVSSNLHDQYQYFVVSATVIYQYDPFEDAWQQLPAPAPAFVGTIAAGASGTRHPWGPRAMATGGSTTTINTNLTLARDLRGYEVRILAGPNAGELRKILRNTVGPNATITVDTPYGTAITAASEYLLLTGRLWIVTAGSAAAGSFKYYDLATNLWASAAGTGAAPAALATDSKLVSTPGHYEDFATGVATAGGASTLTNAGKAWTVNQWTNYQIRIASGTGAGQIRTIASNTATVITTTVAWTTVPDATGNYVIEGNSDFLYLLNGANIYRYSISGAAWINLAPSVARSGAAIAGMSANWVWDVNDPIWADENNSPLNGQYIYSFRGNNSLILDRYNIVTNAWENDIVYAPRADLPLAGNYYVYADNYIYVHIGNTGRIIKYNIPEHRTEPFSQLWYLQSTLHLGDRMFDVDFVDGGTKIKFLYLITNNQNMMFRCMVF